MAKQTKNTLPTPIKPQNGKIPPQAPEIEASVIGALMLEQDAFSDVCDILTPESFYDLRYAKIYRAISVLVTQDRPVDLVTVTEELRKEGVLEEIGGEYFLAQLTSNVLTGAHSDYHAHIVEQKFLARELIRISNDIQTTAYEDSTDVDELINLAEGKIFELSQKNIRKKVEQIDPIIREALKRIGDAANKEGLSGLTSGFKELDKITSGWQPSDLIIIAARPAMGKTAFVLSMAKNIAIDYKIPVALFSLEMSNVQLVNRLISNVCEIEGGKIKSGKLNDSEWRQLGARLKKMEGAPLYLDDTASLSVLELRTKARRLVREHGIKIIIIDYLQLMNASGMSFNSREQEVSIISRSLKGLAKDLDIPIIALSQLNRQVENTKGDGADAKRPQLSNLRESGAIEQDADMVCFIHRPEYYGIYEDSTGNDLRGKAEVIIAKHRNGAVGSVWLRFRGEYAQFLNEQENVVVTRVASGKTHQTSPNEIIGAPIEDNDDETPF